MIQKVPPVILVLLLCCNGLIAQEKETVKKELSKQYAKVVSTADGFRIQETDLKWGYANRKGVVKIPPTYDEILNFSNNRALVRNGSMWGAVDTMGLLQVPLKFDALQSFLGNRTVAKRKGKASIIDKNGKKKRTVLDDVQFQFPYGNNEYIYRKNNFYGIKDFDGKTLVPPQYVNISLIKGRYLQLERHQAKLLYHLKKDLMLPDPYHSVKVIEDKKLIKVTDPNGKLGYLDWELNEIFPLSERDIYYEPRIGKFKENTENGIALLSGKGEPYDLPHFESIYGITDSLIRVRKNNGLSNFIDYNGKFVFSEDFNEVKFNKELQLFSVKRDKEYLVLDKEGNKVLQWPHGRIFFGIDNQLIAWKDGQMGVIDFKGNAILPFEFEKIRKVKEVYVVSKDKKLSTFLSNGRKGPLQDVEDVRSRANFLIGKQNGLWGMVSKTGQSIYPFEFASIRAIGDNHFVLHKDGLGTIGDSLGIFKTPLEYEKFKTPLRNHIVFVKDGRYGLMNTTTFEEVIPAEFSSIRMSLDNLVEVRKGGKKGYFNTAGKVLVPTKYRRISVVDALAGKHLFIVQENGKWGLISDFEEQILPFEYGSIDYNTIFKKKWIWHIHLIKDKKQSLFDIKTLDVVSKSYDLIGEFSNGRYRVRRDDKAGFIDRLGNEVIVPKYDVVSDFEDNGLAKVWKDGKIGYIDLNGKEVIPIKYEEDTTSKGFVQGLAVVKYKGKYGCIDSKGEERIPLIYDEIIDFYNSADSGVVIVVKDGKVGFCDVSGAVIVPPKYDGLSNFSEGRAIYNLNGKSGILDFTGKEVTAPIFSYIDTFSGGLAVYKSDFNFYGYLDRSGQVSIEAKFTSAKAFKNFYSNAEVYHKGKKEFIDRKGVLQKEDGMFEIIEVEEGN